MNDEEKRVLARLTALCAAGEHSESELLERMRRWGVAPQVQSAVMAHLVSHRYVDDERYARAYVRDKLTYNKWGPVKIAYGLRSKGIGEETVHRVLGETGDAEFVAVLRPLLQAKQRATRAKSAYELRQKLMRFAAGRGFTSGQISCCMSEMSDMDDD